MLFYDHPRTHYQNSPLREVVCQLHYPSIPSISSQGLDAFREEVRDAFPRYVCRQDPKPPNSDRPLPYHQFFSGNRRYVVSLTQDFFTLTALRYEDWEDFASCLDQYLAAFIRLYWPGCFLRVGLRYHNILYRSRLGLKDCGWPELLAPAYTAVFQEPEAGDGRLLGVKCDMFLQLDSSCQAKIRSGLSKAPLNPEYGFLLDIDLSMEGKLDCAQAPGAFQTLHNYSTAIFQGAVTDRLREAMKPL